MQTLCIGCASIIDVLHIISYSPISLKNSSATLRCNASILSGASIVQTYADSSLHQLRLQNIHQHSAHSTGLLYLAYISDRRQTSCHSCQGWRSQGCHCIGMADMILQLQKVVQNSLLHT